MGFTFGYGGFPVAGQNLTYAPVNRQQYNSFGPFNNYTYSPTTVRDFNQYSQDKYTYAPRLVDNFNQYHNTLYDYAPQYIQNYNFRPSQSFQYRPSFQRNVNYQPQATPPSIFGAINGYGGYPQQQPATSAPWGVSFV